MSIAELVLLLLGQVFTSGAIYGAIRADLRNIKEATSRAHVRIDELMMKGQR